MPASRAWTSCLPARGTCSAGFFCSWRKETKAVFFSLLEKNQKNHRLLYWTLPTIALRPLVNTHNSMLSIPAPTRPLFTSSKDGLPDRPPATYVTMDCLYHYVQASRFFDSSQGEILYSDMSFNKFPAAFRRKAMNSFLWLLFFSDSFGFAKESNAVFGRIRRIRRTSFDKPKKYRSRPPRGGSQEAISACQARIITHIV